MLSRLRWLLRIRAICESTTKHRCSKETEELLVKSLLVRHALAAVKREHSTGTASYMLVVLIKHVLEYRKAALAVLTADEGDDRTQTQLLGLGHYAASEEWPTLLNLSSWPSAIFTQTLRGVQTLLPATICQLTANTLL